MSGERVGINDIRCFCMVKLFCLLASIDRLFVGDPVWVGVWRAGEEFLDI